MRPGLSTNLGHKVRTVRTNYTNGYLRKYTVNECHASHEELRTNSVASRERNELRPEDISSAL